MTTEANNPDYNVELEDCISGHYFFKRANFTLDDMRVYAVPFADVLRATYDSAERTITDREAFDIMRRSRRLIQELHQKMELEAAADEAAAAA